LPNRKPSAAPPTIGRIVTVKGPEVSPTGRETWRIASGGEVRTVVTSSSTARTMDEVVKRFEKALRRLADE
jgi:molybdopterin-guanine dinucleotide biosynthesis protein